MWLICMSPKRVQAYFCRNIPVPGLHVLDACLIATATSVDIPPFPGRGQADEALAGVPTLAQVRPNNHITQLKTW